MTQSIARFAITMRLRITLILAFALALLNEKEVLAQDAEGSGSGTNDYSIAYTSQYFYVIHQKVSIIIGNLRIRYETFLNSYFQSIFEFLLKET